MYMSKQDYPTSPISATFHRLCAQDTKASLIPFYWSEPHTSVTSLRTCPCMFACLLAWTNSVCDREGLLPECCVGYLELRRLKFGSVSNLKYESVRIDFKAVVFI